MLSIIIEHIQAIADTAPSQDTFIWSEELLDHLTPGRNYDAGGSLQGRHFLRVCVNLFTLPPL